MKNIVPTISQALLLLIVALLIVWLPFSNSYVLMNGIQTAKTFDFIYSVMVLALIGAISLLFRKSKNRINFTLVDILFIAFIVWVSVNKYLIHDVNSLSLKYYELLGLFVLYLVIRFIDKKYYLLLFIAICLSGTVQAIYGSLQLWGVYPSNHGLFNMTGSFFNPGPYAGFLCAILPVAVGVYLSYREKETGQIGATLRNSFDATRSKLTSFTFEKFDAHNVSRLYIRKLFSHKIDSVKSESNICEVPMNIRSKREASNGEAIKHEVSNNQTIIEENHQARSEAECQTRSVKRETSNLFEQLKFLAIKYIALITIITILLVLPAARSRAAWLGAIAGVAYLAWHKYGNKQRSVKRRSIKLFKRTVIVSKGVLAAILFMVMLAGTLGLYHFKKDSADGRILIWTVTANIIKDNPLLGVGQDRFKTHYMDYQADYFRNNPDSKFGMMADDNQYAFNEVLLAWCENGLIGLLLLLAILCTVFLSNSKEIESLKSGLLTSVSFRRGTRRNPFNNDGIPLSVGMTNHSNSAASNASRCISGSNSEASNNERSELSNAQRSEAQTILKSSLLAILVFGLFAYPSEILPIKIVAITCLGLLANYLALNTSNSEALNDEVIKHEVSNGAAKLGIVVAILLLIIFAYPKISALKNACVTWKDAMDLYYSGLYEESLEDYENAYSVLKYNGEYLVNYGKALSIAEKHTEAITILEQAKSYQSNSVLYNALGDSYKALEKYDDAEQPYWQAANMSPAKFYPLYLLAKLYDASGQQEKALEMANTILNKEVKVHSTAIDEIKEEMQQIIEQ